MSPGALAPRDLAGATQEHDAVPSELLLLSLDALDVSVLSAFLGAKAAIATFAAGPSS